MNLSSSFLERLDRHVCIRASHKRRGGLLDPRELCRGARAAVAIFRLDTIARDIERRAAAADKIVKRIALPWRQEILDHQRRRITVLFSSIGPANEKAHLRHRPAPAAPRSSRVGHGLRYPNY